MLGCREMQGKQEMGLKGVNQENFSAKSSAVTHPGELKEN